MQKILHAHIVILCVTNEAVIQGVFKNYFCMHVICSDKSMVGNSVLFAQERFFEVRREDFFFESTWL